MEMSPAQRREAKLRRVRAAGRGRKRQRKGRGLRGEGGGLQDALMGRHRKIVLDERRKQGKSLEEAPGCEGRGMRREAVRRR